MCFLCLFDFTDRTGSTGPRELTRGEEGDFQDFSLVLTHAFKILCYMDYFCPTESYLQKCFQECWVSLIYIENREFQATS